MMAFPLPTMWRIRRPQRLFSSSRSILLTTWVRSSTDVLLATQQLISGDLEIPRSTAVLDLQSVQVPSLPKFLTLRSYFILGLFLHPGSCFLRPGLHPGRTLLFLIKRL